MPRHARAAGETRQGSKQGSQNDRSTSQLSQRLRTVLKEEKDLRKSVQGDTDTPFIRHNFFKEVFESERGSKLIFHGAELSPGGSEDELEQEEVTSPPDIKQDDEFN